MQLHGLASSPADSTSRLSPCFTDSSLSTM